MKKVAFILSTELGWSTYARQLKIACENQTDFEPIFWDYSFPKAWKPWLHWVNSRRSLKGRLKPLIDPLFIIRHHLGPKWKDFSDQNDISHVHAASHIVGEAVRYATPEIPFSVALDITRPLSQRNFPRVSWSSSELERESLLLNSARTIFPMSAWVRQSLVDDYHCKNENIIVQTPAVNVIEFVEPNRARSDRIKVVFVGNDFQRKGGDRLISWAKGPLRDHIELFVVSGNKLPGRDGENVHYLGGLQNQAIVKRILPEMDVFCLPTKVDMSPFAVVEALVAGVPVVISNVGGIPDLIEHGANGFLIDVNDDSGFVNTLKGLANNRDKLNHMQENAMNSGRLRFDSNRSFGEMFATILNN